MLRVEAINSGYGNAQVLRDVSLDVAAGEILCLMGRNGAGKTTAMKTIMGLLPLMSGRITLDGQDVGRLPAHEVARAGIGYIPQGRRLFTELTVAQNLEIGLMTRKSGPHVRTRVLELFPRLSERLNQRAETLSGGEQQMLATARALCIEPKVLILDEPTEGLQPSMIEAIRDVVVRLRNEGVAILLVEQRVDAVLALADRVAFLENGILAETVTPERMRTDAALLKRYLGV
ncbi:ABC transporter ATP-binding protein [Oceanibium sediminis]|uniref:ABC transporter ATP-binding protein n=1 Tax=Oceanibium sediminis TaxID=2026339 RepID=UPI000DD3A3F3|nr:ABC transporter ATP-binding protein [Oceanibium sediminis]